MDDKKKWDDAFLARKCVRYALINEPLDIFT